MHPLAYIPSPEPIPAAWWLFEVLLLATFTAHILLVNVVLGGSAVAFIESLRERQAPWARPFSAKIPTALALAVNFGVAPLLFLQVLYGHFVYTSSVLMAVFWLGVTGLAMLAYYGLYLTVLRHESLGRAKSLVLGLTVLLLLAVAFVFSNNMTLMLAPERWSAYFARPDGTLLNLGDPTLVPRWLHFVTASLALGGLALAAWSKCKANHSDETALAGVVRGMRWFSSATLVQLCVGLWFLFSQPAAIRSLFLGGGSLHTAALGLAVALALAALYLGHRKRVWPTVWVVAATVALMVCVRALLRAAYLAPYFSPSELTVVSQPSPLLVFILSLLLAAAAIAYMLRLALRASAAPAEDATNGEIEDAGESDDTADVRQAIGAPREA
ncbi:hypothetical protein [Desulfocurvibacter africanus]|uniref:hypothetical protein n=1 Tax=Desulfocurvibacter africanus TaxID=873 RepID=UPI0003F9D169|nr:hypothetical protein [Desulfocurvibacter africanus]